MAEPTVPIYFSWEQASADPRQYNQQRTLLKPTVLVAVDVPLKHEYVYNAEEIIKAQLSADRKIPPVLTPAGMRYCDDQLVAAYQKEQEPIDESEIKWDAEKEEPEQEDWVDNLDEEETEDAGWVTDEEEELESLEALEDENKNDDEDLEDIIEWK